MTSSGWCRDGSRQRREGFDVAAARGAVRGDSARAAGTGGVWRACPAGWWRAQRLALFAWLPLLVVGSARAAVLVDFTLRPMEVVSVLDVRPGGAGTPQFSFDTANASPTLVMLETTSFDGASRSAYDEVPAGSSGGRREASALESAEVVVQADGTVMANASAQSVFGPALTDGTSASRAISRRTWHYTLGAYSQVTLRLPYSWRTTSDGQFRNAWLLESGSVWGTFYTSFDLLDELDEQNFPALDAQGLPIPFDYRSDSAFVGVVRNDRAFAVTGSLTWNGGAEAAGVSGYAPLEVPEPASGLLVGVAAAAVWRARSAVRRG